MKKASSHSLGKFLEETDSEESSVNPNNDRNRMEEIEHQVSKLAIRSRMPCSMQASLQYRRAQERSLGMVKKEADEDLDQFFETARQEKEKNDIIFNFSAEYDDSTASNPDSSVVSDEGPALIAYNTVIDDLLDAPDNAKKRF